MIRPQPPRLRIKRRNTVSVTPAMGARTVAGAIRTLPMKRVSGTSFSGSAWRTKPALSLSKGVSAPHELFPFELSQNFFTFLFYLARLLGPQNESPRGKRGPILQACLQELLLRQFGLCCSGRILGVLAAEALHASSGVHQLLLARKKRMARRADFYADVSMMRRPGNKGIAASAMHANFVISGMNSCFHGFEPQYESLDSTGIAVDSAIPPQPSQPSAARRSSEPE